MPSAKSKAAERAAAKGMSPMTPYLNRAGAADAIAFYKMAFGAEEMARIPGRDGKIMHACLSINGDSVLLGDEFGELGAIGPKTLGGSPVTIHLIVDDADAWVARAEKAGATVVMPVAEQFWGDRYGVIKDPFGHAWSMATAVRTLTEEELFAATTAALAAMTG